MSKATRHAPTDSWAGHVKGTRGYSRVLAALALAGVATFAQLYSTQAVLPLMASELQITAAEAALSISLATVGLAATVLPWSFLADRIGRVRAMAIGIAVATVVGLLVPLAPTVPVLLGLRTLEGMALGGIPAIAIAYLNEEVTKVHTALAAGTYVAGTTLGGLAGRLVAGPVGELWGWRAATLAVSLLATVSAVLFLVIVPKQRRFSPAPALGFRGACRTLGGHAGNPKLLALYLQAFLLMGGFVAVYNYLGFRLHAEPFALPATVVSLIFLAYLSGTVSSRWAAGLTTRFGRRNVLVAGIAIMSAGLAMTLLENLAATLSGLVIFTGGFFAAHSVGSGWTGAIATSGRAQAASLYNLSYYLGSSVIGWAGGLAFQAFGWTALALSVIALSCTTAAVTLIVHRSP
ncbi:MFS transporter [Paenarthrobacter aurescens]|uniref:MFS transporter n=1 Tax=Paenarthrobacter aurescens TaxID=43663 RepID=A0A4Y3NG99_PAEAU|nr:MFS transporter [Paenarthrobacter aurescens]MDO6144243.1 MFS transporter [Paenarthrobacter aurescens]MDO6148090.1 MFS transporter [Paenarthrobacter aurescens]MDO6159334.1 MFS transporter [Paenarthrobacter aurescens]MDO6163317.1 MFS transporter [Paenarthrobacter aurescens]GEB20840.1 MFS transporter [Paenarthrobacter aurescens]